ncbi:MAG TPA: ATP F0F1 synthase subunit B [Devosiaceae bacterium]
MTLDAEFYVIVALVIFVAILFYLKVPQMAMRGLDGRIGEIEKQLEEARKLREEAQALLADYERKRKAAESEAQDIVTAAREEAERMTEEAAASVEDLIARRTKAVEEKISQAEAQALAEVRARSADVAVEAARVLLAQQVAENGDALIEEAIKDVGSKLN